MDARQKQISKEIVKLKHNIIGCEKTKANPEDYELIKLQARLISDTFRVCLVLDKFPINECIIFIKENRFIEGFNFFNRDKLLEEFIRIRNMRK